MNIGSLILSGIAIGCIYALMALAINVVFSAQRIVNFAQGDITMMSGLVAASLITAWAWPYWAAAIGAAVVAAMLGVLIERVALRPLGSDETSIAWILSIFAVAILLSNGMVLMFGTEPRQLPSLASARPYSLGDLQIVPDQLVAIAGTVLFMVLFHLLQTRTLYGKALRACSRDPQMAAMLGMCPNRSVKKPRSRCFSARWKARCRNSSKGRSSSSGSVLMR